MTELRRWKFSFNIDNMKSWNLSKSVIKVSKMTFLYLKLFRSFKYVVQQTERLHITYNAYSTSTSSAAKVLVRAYLIISNSIIFSKKVMSCTPVIQNAYSLYRVPSRIQDSPNTVIYPTFFEGPSPSSSPRCDVIFKRALISKQIFRK